MIKITEHALYSEGRRKKLSLIGATIDNRGWGGVYSVIGRVPKPRNVKVKINVKSKLLYNR